MTRSNSLGSLADIVRRNRLVMLAVAVLVGYLIAKLIMTSVPVAIVFFTGAATVILTVLVRRVDFLIGGWLVLTTFIHKIQANFPPDMSEKVGTALFWGGFICIATSSVINTIMRKERLIPFSSPPLKIVTLIFFLWATMTLSISPNVLWSATQLSHILLGVVGTYVFYDYFCRRLANFRRVINLVVFTAGIVGVLTVFQGIKLLAQGEGIWKNASLAAWFYNTNSMGFFSFVLLPLVISETVVELNPKLKRAKFVVIILLSFSLYFSSARGAWLAFGVAASYMLWRSEFKTTIRVCTTLGLLAMAFLMPIFGSKLMDTVGGVDYTGRKDIWKAARAASAERPILGWGIGNAPIAKNQYIPEDLLWLFKDQDTHSAYLKNSVEMGPFSAALMIAAYLIFFWQGWMLQDKIKSSYLRSVCRGATGTIMGMATHCYFENGFLLTPFASSEFSVLWPYITVGIPFAAKYLDDQDQANKTAGHSGDPRTEATAI